jgi:hypothetical protein
VERTQATQVRRCDLIAMQDELVALDLPRGSGYDSQSGLNNLFPRVFGRLAAEGCGRRVAFIVIHPTSNFMRHYLIGPCNTSMRR